MNKFLLLTLFILISAIGTFILPSCKPVEEELQNTGGLEFSADTVKFDTVFTTLSTITKRLWIYNRNRRGVNVELIGLANPVSSPYTLIINGDLKQTANNIFIRGQDSLLILVRANLPDNGQSGIAKDYVLQENINFQTNGNSQHVLLRSFGQNIYLHDGTTLPCGAIWKNDRPHVLYGTVTVPVNCTLTIKPGTRVYAHAGAALLVEGTLLANSPVDFHPGTGLTDTVKATSPNIVRFSGDRTEVQYVTAPGQWRGIIFDSGSHGNLIRYTQIQNSTFGVLLYNPNNLNAAPDVQISNSVIRYISGNNVGFAGVASSLGLPGAGVLSLAGKVAIENTLFSDCYEYAILGYGGKYDINFCTIANYPATSAVRKTSSVTFDNMLATNGQSVVYNPAITLRNSIVWGSIDDEIDLENYHQYSSTVSIKNSVLKTQDYLGITDSGDKAGLANTAYSNLFTDPLFFRFNTGSASSTNYKLQVTSPARKRGIPVGNSNPVRDLLNLPRDPLPSLGAYESTK